MFAKFSELITRTEAALAALATTLVSTPFWNDFFQALWPFLSHISVACGAFIGVVTVVGIVRRWVHGS